MLHSQASLNKCWDNSKCLWIRGMNTMQWKVSRLRTCLLIVACSALWKWKESVILCPDLYSFLYSLHSHFCNICYHASPAWKFLTINCMKRNTQGLGYAINLRCEVSSLFLPPLCIFLFQFATFSLIVHGDFLKDGSKVSHAWNVSIINVRWMQRSPNTIWATV